MAGRSMVLTIGLTLAMPAISQDYAREIAASAALHDICQTDRGQLWGAELCGPLIVVDPSTRAVWANQAAPEGGLQRQEVGWIGTLPPGIGVANTSTEWAGVRWIMVVSPLPAADLELRVLIAHEAWHRIQASIGLAAQGSDCEHLESERGRYYLRLELRALRRALTTRGASRWRAVGDALAFRKTRLQEFPSAGGQEGALDRNEGLASYTGVKLGAGPQSFDYAARTLAKYDNHDAFARAYAYASGPAYGLLLDERQPNWRAQLGADAPADVLARAIRTQPATSSLENRAARYGGAAVAAEEHTRAETQRTRITQLRSRFSAGPRVFLPLKSMKMEFDPNQVTPVEGLGGVYRVLTIRDAWGELRASEGALIASDFKQAIAAAPDSTGLAGPGWTLSLNSGYRLSAADALGVMQVEPILVAP